MGNVGFNGNKDLNSLIERAWALHGRLNCEIEKSVNFCRFCSERGRYCDIADQTPFEERKRLIVIRDSVNHVENILLSLQKLQSWQLRERNEALTRLEERRLVLIELVRNYKGRTLDVVREINACLRDEKDKNTNLQIKKWPDLVRGIKKLFFMKWKYWQKAVWFGVKFLIFTTSMSSLVHLNHTRNLSSSPRRRKVSSFLDSTEAEMRDCLLSISWCPLNVFHGKG